MSSGKVRDVYAPADGGACALDQTTADGTAEVAVVESGSVDCALMRDRWTAYFRWTGPKQGTAAFAEVGDGWTCSIIPLSATLPGQTDWITLLIILGLTVVTIVSRSLFFLSSRELPKPGGSAPFEVVGSPVPV